VDKTLFNLLIIKLVKKIYENIVVSISTTAINDGHSSHRNGFMSTARIHQKRPVASRFARTLDYHVWGAMLEAYHKLHPKRQVNSRTQRSGAGDLGQPATGTDQQGC